MPWARVRLLLVSLLLVGCPPPPPGPGKAPAPPPAEESGTRGLSVAKRAQPEGPLALGAYHALVVGINDYQHHPKLKTAVHDAEGVAQVLQRDYGFEVELLVDATSERLQEVLWAYRSKLSETDNLLVYYAGHGYQDPETKQSYWLPADATETPSKWISNATIADVLKAIPAKHVLIVSDSCYSGSLTRAVNVKIEGEGYLAKIAAKRARVVLTSGGEEPVSDSGGGEHSVFARQFIDALRANEGVIDGHALFGQIRRPVMLAADQTPEYGDIRKCGHEGGDFLFARRGALQTTPAPEVTAPSPETSAKIAELEAKLAALEAKKKEEELRKKIAALEGKQELEEVKPEEPEEPEPRPESVKPEEPEEPEPRPEPVKRAYEHRRPGPRERLLALRGGSFQTEAAVASALRWLAAHQAPSGRLAPDDCVAACGQEFAESRHDVGLTGLGLLAFLGTHEGPSEGSYKTTVAKALTWLCGQQADDGRVGQSQLYGHAIATLALCEAAALGGDAEVRQAAVRALRFCLAAQNDNGAWDYRPRSVRGDTSVTGWFVQALSAGHDAGLLSAADAQHVFSGVQRWLRQATADSGKVGYTAAGNGRMSMTAVGALARILDPTRTTAPPLLAEGLALVAKSPPSSDSPDPYYWYYAAHAYVLRPPSKAWRSWNAALRSSLLQGQAKGGPEAGSWEKSRHLTGRGCATALSALTLQAYYRLLPQPVGEDR